MPAGKQVQCGKPGKYGLKQGCFAFSESDFNLVRINHLLDEALEAADLQDKIEVIRTFEKKLPRVDCSLLLVDVFLELITNARKAMEDRIQQRLQVRTCSDQDDAGLWVIVEIKDTGSGITPEQMMHLWNMFQQSEDGLGFGLWWLRTFIERQGGSIKCHSEPDKGSVFVVRLPAAIGRQPSR